MSNTTSKDYLNETQQQQLRLIAIMAVKAVLSAPGSLPTSHFRRLSKLVETTKQQHPFDTSNTKNTLRQRMAFDEIFEDALCNHFAFSGNFGQFVRLLEDAKIIADYSAKIAESRDIIRQESGLLSAKKLLRHETVASDWITLDLLAHCWNRGRPYCPDILGAMWTCPVLVPHPYLV